MKCPVCDNNLVEYATKNFAVDICRDGCAGIWLDKGELEKCNDYHEEFSAELLRVKKNADVAIDRNKARLCPKCVTVTMAHTAIDPERNFEIDTCPQCQGHWLDIGELGKIRLDSKENDELRSRMRIFEAKLQADLNDPEKSQKVAAFVRLLFK